MQFKNNFLFLYLQIYFKNIVVNTTITYAGASNHPEKLAFASQNNKDYPSCPPACLKRSASSFSLSIVSTILPTLSSVYLPMLQSAFSLTCHLGEAPAPAPE